MKIVHQSEKEKVCLVDSEEPTVTDNYAKVKIHTAPVCNEYIAFVRDREGPMGGHEAAGEVVEVGPKVTRVAVGDRVVVMPQSACGT